MVASLAPEWPEHPSTNNAGVAKSCSAQPTWLVSLPSHAKLPSWAQGAGIEDGAALAACLAKVAGPDIFQALRLYESLRLPRASRVGAASKQNKTRFHLPDGPQQRERDAQLGDASTDWFLKLISWVYGHDAEAVDDPTPAASIDRP